MLVSLHLVWSLAISDFFPSSCSCSLLVVFTPKLVFWPDYFALGTSYVCCDYFYFLFFILIHAVILKY